MVQRALVYFAIRGRAEPIRLTLEEAGLAYEDRFVSAEEWRTLKASTPFGELPLYEENGVLIAHSQAIIRHIARGNTLYGRTEAQRTLCDVVEETFVEAEDAFWKPLWDPDTAKSMVAFAMGPLKHTLKNMDAQLARSHDAYWTGDEVTFADFLAFHYLDEVAALYPAILAEFPRLETSRARIAARPRVAAYLNSGRRSPALGVGIKGPVIDPRVAVSNGVAAN
jgi:glutathione S-transferase